MDLRIEKTKKSIINAFLQLRSQKTLAKITIKELSELAKINKATFYLHYHDIYDLSESLENEIIQSTLHAIEHPEAIINDNKMFTEELTKAFISNQQLIKILFRDNRSINFVTIFEKKLKELILDVHPEYKESPEKNMALTYLIYGGYYTYFKYSEYDVKLIFELIGKLSDKIIELYE